MRQKRRSAAEWTEICREYRASGEPAEVFARRRGLKRSTLLWWASRLRQQIASEVPQSSFVEVVAAQTPPAPARAVVRVGEVAVEFREAVPPAQWVAELASLC